jgi:hypothetical protein
LPRARKTAENGESESGENRARLDHEHVLYTPFQRFGVDVATPSVQRFGVPIATPRYGDR